MITSIIASDQIHLFRTTLSPQLLQWVGQKECRFMFKQAFGCYEYIDGNFIEHRLPELELWECGPETRRDSN